MAKRRSFSKEFKHEAVQMATGGESVLHASSRGFGAAYECLEPVVPRTETGGAERVSRPGHPAG